MLITNNATKTIKTTSLKRLVLVITLSFLPLTSFAADELTNSEVNSEQYTLSKGQLKKTLDDHQREDIIKTQKMTNVPDQLNGNATAKTRESILATNNKMVRRAKNGIISQSHYDNYNADFAIYSATSFLQEDYDGDGYYQTFSVTFDADMYAYTHNQFGEVYALLYLSKNGGPWTHYFTTDVFIIEGDSDQDEYEVITTFLSGYSSDDYDVLIDLYQVGYNDIISSYSSDDSNALYALPLESADYDEPYNESYIEVVEVHGGSIYGLTLLLLGVCLFRVKMS